MNIDPAKVLQAARTGVPLVIQTTRLPPQTEADLEEILGIFLRELGQDGVKNHLAYCLRELTGNAKKANTKRIYFSAKKLDIANPVDYERGMATFKAESFDDIDRLHTLQEEAGLHIRVTFLIRDFVLHLRVSNNAPLMPVERTRAELRIAGARTYETMEQAFEEVLDESEGAGLGITILILMLRKMGLTDKAFSLVTTKDETVASLRIPANDVHLDLVTKLADELVALVDSLPPFPENLRQLLRLLEKPDVGFDALAARLSLDPALTSDLIRYINSAGKGRKARVTNLRDAVQMVGLQGIREMILPYGAQKLLERFVSQQKILWSEAQRISSLSMEMAKEFRFERQDCDLAQIAGLLSTLGRIVVTYLHPKLDTRIRTFCRQRKISPDRFNDLTQTINPSELGARVAEKWAFPSNLIDVLRYQTWPDQVPRPLHAVVCVIHLAARLDSRQIDPEVLEALNLAGPGKLEALRTRLKHS